MSETVRYYSVEPSTIRNCTVGWLLSEVIRQLQVTFGEACVTKKYSYKHVVGVKFRNATEILDYLLTQYERPMIPIQERDELEILYSGIMNK